MVDTGIEPVTISLKGKKFTVDDCIFQAIAGLLDSEGALGIPEKG